MHEGALILKTESDLAARMRDALRRFGRDAVDFVYGRTCVQCRAALLPAEEPFGGADRHEGKIRFCRTCHEELRCGFEHVCLRCGAPAGPHLNTAGGCQHCRRDRFRFERVFALGTYEGALHECCLRGKQEAGEPLIAGLTGLLWEVHRDALLESGIDLVLPVPHHWTERLSRRHLPPATMGLVLARRLMVPQSLHILAKLRRTPAQSSLTAADRRNNLRNAFGIAGGARLHGLTVLLTDDILTTGTTADRASRVLKEAGAEQVVVAVLARAVGRNK